MIILLSRNTHRAGFHGRQIIIDQAVKGGIVPREQNLRDHLSLVNFGALIPNIDVIRAISGNFSLVLVIESSFFIVLATEVTNSAQFSVIYKARVLREK